MRKIDNLYYQILVKNEIVKVLNDNRYSYG